MRPKTDPPPQKDIGTLRRSTAVVLKVLGCLMLLAIGYVTLEVVLGGLALNNRISHCSDGSHPDFIADNAERVSTCGHE